MKKHINPFLLAALALFSAFSAGAQNSGIDSTGLPGDNFSLQGALQMFQKATSIEEFETFLNKEDNSVNNLDLNEDGDIDYVRVISKMDKDVHAFIIQVAVSASENQDIAVIELEKTGNEIAVLQIIGDEDIYGEELIVEPDEVEDGSSYIDWSNNNILSGPNSATDEYSGTNRIVINVWLWPSVRFVFGVNYVPWISPWRWNYYPGWWKPWKPYRWHVWHPRRVVYHRSFVVVTTHRVGRAHKIYTPYRTTSVTVRTRHSASLGNYRVTRTKTSVTGPKGKTTTVKKTTVTGPKGGKATKVKVRKH
ncbi:MAG: hypothetical protein HOP10_09880 [Chitinophagaceae bacterium]|nr:hypothetical protein [Chitinophagaceae bacterium]